MTDYKDDKITVCIPTIPPRVGPGGLLYRAVMSARNQSEPPLGGIAVSLDVDRTGAAVNRQRALDTVRTEWTAFLDDDDTLYPNHFEVLHNLVREHEADFAYSWFDGNNPFPMHRGRQMNLEEPHHTTMTVLVRTEVAHAAGGFDVDMVPLHPEWMGEDWRFIVRCVELGKRGQCTFIGTPEITWTYSVHGTNTSGLGSRW